MSQKKPGWAKTKLSWETRKAIWLRWAMGDTLSQTLTYFDLNKGKYTDAPAHRDTIRQARLELLELPAELAPTLIEELPEVKSLIEELRPDLKDNNEIITSEAQKLEVLKAFISKQQARHFERMAEMARTYLSKGLDELTEVSVGNSTQYFYPALDFDRGITMSKEDLYTLLSDRDHAMGYMYEEYNECFDSHFDAELEQNPSTKGKTYGDLFREQPLKIIQIYKDLANRGSFHGTCLLCQDWYE